MAWRGLACSTSWSLFPVPRCQRQAGVRYGWSGGLPWSRSRCWLASFVPRVCSAAPSCAVHHGTFVRHGTALFEVTWALRTVERRCSCAARRGRWTCDQPGAPGRGPCLGLAAVRPGRDGRPGCRSATVSGARARGGRRQSECQSPTGEQEAGSGSGAGVGGAVRMMASTRHGQGRSVAAPSGARLGRVGQGVFRDRTR